MTDSIIVNHFRNKFNNITKKPEKLISAPAKLINNVKELIKETYDFTKREETTPTGLLQDLIIDDFDIEQIWQQIELQNESILTGYLSSVSKLVATKDRLWFVNISKDELNKEDYQPSEDDESNSEDTEHIEDEENIEQNQEISESEESIEENNEAKNKLTKKRQKSIVDDEFFKLDEMEQFLKREEQPSKTEESDDEESVDLFENNFEEMDPEDQDSEAENNPKYDDFFGESNTTKYKKRKDEVLDEVEINGEDEQIKNKKRKVTFDDETDREFENTEKNLKSTLEIREERLKRKIEDIEGIALEEKPWQLKGEVTADKRPQNSLLEEIVDFDLSVRPAPVVTEETTMRLEDVIKQRIKDKVWDDVERKTKVTETPLEYKKKLLLDQEKNKLSLAQIYEDEYLKQQESLDPNSIDKPEDEPAEHLEIKSMMKSLFTKLDALCNFHFTPKTVAPEVRIVSNLPAISMEEVAPIAASDASVLAPEEVKNKLKGDEIGKAERSDTDKNRERRKKKLKQREHAKAKKQKEKLLEKIKPGLGNKYSKQKAAKLLDTMTKQRNVDKMDESIGNKNVKSSTAFFTQLQDEVKGHIKSKTTVQKTKSKQVLTARKLKL